MLLACLLAFASASPAFAKKNKRPDPAATLAIEPAPAPDKFSAGPARFFRIQDVLDAAGGKDLRIAALGDTQSDAIGLRGSIALLTGTEPFGLFAFRAPEGILWQKWRGLEAEFATDLEAIERCRADDAQCTPAARRLVALVDTLKDRDGRARLDAVNRAVNEAIRYQSDMQQFGEADRWLSPLAAFTSRLGDCEDYVIAKYFALREAGFPAGRSAFRAGARPQGARRPCGAGGARRRPLADPRQSPPCARSRHVAGASHAAVRDQS